MARLRSGLVVAGVVAMVAVGAGCTFLASFNNDDDATSDGGAKSTTGTTDSSMSSGDTGGSDGAIGEGDDAPAPGDDDASPGPTTDAAPGMTTLMEPTAFTLPDGASSLTIVADCHACTAYNQTNPNGAYTCGKSADVTACGPNATSSGAVYSCNPSSPDNPIHGFTCPAAEPCWAADPRNATCDPCDKASSQTGVSTVWPAFRSGDAPYCVTCMDGVAQYINECTTEAACENSAATQESGCATTSLQ